MLRRKKFHRSGRHTFTGGIHTHWPLTVMRTTGFVPSVSNAQPENRIWFPLTETSSTDASGREPVSCMGGASIHGGSVGLGVDGSGGVLGMETGIVGGGSVGGTVTVGGTVLNAGSSVVVGAPGGAVVVVTGVDATRSVTFNRGYDKPLRESVTVPDVTRPRNADTGSDG